MTKLLCKPCAVDLAARGKTVKPVAQRCEKITCSECGRRRFGITYEVTGRATRKKGGNEEMSQKGEKYARRMERRVDKLEQDVAAITTEQTTQGGADLCRGGRSGRLPGGGVRP